MTTNDYNVDFLKKEVQYARTKNYFARIENFYRTLPKTDCEKCGKCCYDPPVSTYVEFMYAYELYDSFDKETKRNILKKSYLFRTPLVENDIRVSVQCFTDSRESIDSMLAGRSDGTHDCKIFLCAFFTSEASRDLGFYFYHSQIAFRLIVIKGYTEILYKQAV